MKNNFGSLPKLPSTQLALLKITLPPKNRLFPDRFYLSVFSVDIVNGIHIFYGMKSHFLSLLFVLSAFAMSHMARAVECDPCNDSSIPDSDKPEECNEDDDDDDCDLMADIFVSDAVLLFSTETQSVN
jgi:hypothetical protein